MPSSMLGFRWSGGGGAWCSAAPHGLGCASSLHLRIPTLLRRRTLALLGRPDGGGGGVVRSPDVVDLEYADLNLRDLYGAGHLGHVRIRQHVNPLSSAFSRSAGTSAGSGLESSFPGPDAAASGGYRLWQRQVPHLARKKFS